MAWNDLGKRFDGAGPAIRDPQIACLLFARDGEDAERQRVVLEEYGIFAQLGHASTGLAPTDGLGVPLIVAPDDQERANMILASIDAVGDEPWSDDDQLDDDADEFDDDDDDLLPDDDDDEDDDDDFDDDLDDDL
jgi:hypothetical protein